MTAHVLPQLPASTLERCRAALLVSACAYLLLLPTGALSFWRSLAFATAAALTIVVVMLQRSSGDRVPPIGRAIPIAVAAWAVWSFVSLAWSVDRSFSASELKADVLWGLVTIAIFYVAATLRGGFRALAVTFLAALAGWSAIAAGLALSPDGWDSRLLHRGEGAFATYLVTVAPFIALLVWQPPAGLAGGRGSLLAAGLLIGLVLVSARLSDNRIVWIAFAVSLIVVAFAAPPRASRRWKTGAIALLIGVIALLFVDAARQRAELAPVSEGSMAATIVTDPRLAIWRHATDRISARPWHGYGYGLHILGRELGSDTGDPKVMHPHNLLVSQWLQTGAIGFALFVAMLGAAGLRFFRFVASRDVELARYGALGLAVLAGFTIRNLTDDFFTRANGKLLFAACAVLLGAGALRLQALRTRSNRE